MYLVFEGLDGSYKSTVCEKLLTTLKARKIKSKMFRQPGGTPQADRFRAITKEQIDGENLTLFSEAMLFLAARSQLFHYEIEPALQDGNIVISDRCNLSTIAYQSVKGESEEYLTSLITTAPWFVKADILFVIRIPAKLAERRISLRGEPSDHLEKRLTHCEKVYSSYNTSRIAKETIYIDGIDADGHELTSDEMCEIALKHTLSKLMENQWN
ncbi:dTMP kinase [Vibrio coralliirubri]|uniref:dTMP kinase n=1 Tax=Vibrio coralliirubri TaxID=1516159 RepID=UPI002284F061|nr:dTMP kinase [Vibrio coralliirubri]